MSLSAVYPGSFDPFTAGHFGIVERAAELFGEFHLLIAHNEEKNHLFPGDDRKEIVDRTVAQIDNEVRVELNTGLTDEYIERHDIDVLVRGLRNGDDLRYEMELEEYFQQTTDAEVVYLTPCSEHLQTSSTVVRRFLENGHTDKAREYLHPTTFEAVRELL
jgi:pantetheine-phosphate adenylyltransferase